MPDRSDAPLFQPYSLGALDLSSRAVMSPMTRSRAPGGVPNLLMARYYAQRAGAGLIVTEGTSPSPNGLGYPRIPGIFSAEQVEGWRLVTEAVHRAGGRIFLQLMHTGRVSHPANLPEGARVLAPSSVALAETKMWVDQTMSPEPIPTPEAMTSEEVESTIEEYATAARNAVAAGFDGIELHGANGYLIEQFIHPHTNRRDDAWGGSVEARIRFALEVARACAEAIGPERVGVRISPYGKFNEMPRYPEIEEAYVAIASGLGALDLAYLHIIDPISESGRLLPEGVRSKLRDAFGGPVILAGGYDFDSANDDVDSGDAEMIAFARLFLANPDLLRRFATGAGLNPPRPQLFYAGGEEGYTDYPLLDD